MVNSPRRSPRKQGLGQRIILVETNREPNVVHVGFSHEEFIVASDAHSLSIATKSQSMGIQLDLGGIHGLGGAFASNGHAAGAVLASMVAAALAVVVQIVRSSHGAEL